MMFVGKELLVRFTQVIEAILPDWDGKPETNEPDMLEIVNRAKQEWLASQKYFNSVSDPDLIDHAIMLTDAAQKKYMYLLRQAKSHGLKALQPENAPSEKEPACLPIQSAG